MAALESYQGAILAEPVGTGKTWISLGVASSTAVETVAIVPAILQHQWDQAAVATSVQLTVWSHERVSRGLLPPGNPRLVIIDEAHRFRNPRTRRVTTLAPWLRGRKTLACTATPIVNRIDDLLTLLKLLFPTNQLSWDGIRHFDELRPWFDPPRALRRLVIRSPLPTSPSPWSLRSERYSPLPDELARIDRGVSLIESLRGSQIGGIARLIRNTLFDALASSDAALRTALVRYRSLLWQASEAGRCSRTALRSFAGEALEQCVFWSLLPLSDESGEIPLEDLPSVEAAIRAIPRGGSTDLVWLTPLLARLAEITPALCFTRHLATARLMRSQQEGAAWIDGRQSGIGLHHFPRAAVLEAFGPGRRSWKVLRRLPEVLITTEVAAEGLDLQGVRAVVHLDLPWTDTRLKQREGRALRSGQKHSEVTILRRETGPQLRSRLRQAPLIAHKEQLAARWLSGLTEPERAPITAMGNPEVPCTAITADQSHDVVVLKLTTKDREGLLMLGRESQGQWTPLRIVELPEQVVTASVQPAEVTAGAVISSAITAARLWLKRGERSWSPALIWRVQILARKAARNRDSTSLNRLDQLLHWLTLPPRLGDLVVAEALAQAQDEELLATLPPQPGNRPDVNVTPIAAILYRPERKVLRCRDDSTTDSHRPVRP